MTNPPQDKRGHGHCADGQAAPDDREALSALFDGELDRDAGRFALRRLGHDPAWRASCGRWQLAGDVLRGQAAAVAAGGFAGGVAARLALEDVGSIAAVASTDDRPGRRIARGWVPGVALAASVAVAALFVVRPTVEPVEGPAAVATLPAATPGDIPSDIAGTDARTPAAPVGAPAATLASAAIAMAEVPRRASERRAAREAGQQPSTRAQAVARDPAVVVASQVPVAPAEPAAAPNPFQPGQADFGSRPWPRAVLPDYRAAGALTASVGQPVASPSAGAPSFYPFVPPADGTTRFEVPPADTDAPPVP